MTARQWITGHRGFSFFLGLVLLVAWPVAANAHKASDSYLTLNVSPDEPQLIRGQWDIALRDLNRAITLDANGDGNITWGEVRARHADIAAYSLVQIAIKSDGIVCNITPGKQLIDTHTDGAYTVLKFTADCDKEIPNNLLVSYHLFADIDPSHRGIITLHHGEQTTTSVLGPDHSEVTLSLNEPDRWRQFKSFMMDGIWHIWTGYDHIMFLISLLLPAVLVYRSNKDGARHNTPQRQRSLSASGSLMSGQAALHWEAAPALWPASVEIIKVITAFTISHTATLTLAVLGIVDLPSRLVESGIALSVILAAMNNIYPIVRHRVWLVAFAFGFIHGLGFASALSGLDLPPLAMAASIGGFNVGVEIGQEAIVLVLMPLAFLIRGTRLYQMYIVRVGSVIITLVAAGWFIQRAFDTKIPWFSALLPG